MNHKEVLKEILKEAIWNSALMSGLLVDNKPENIAKGIYLYVLEPAGW